MSEETVTSIISIIETVAVAVFGVRGWAGYRQLKRETKTVRDEVTNNHTVNLRDDLDAKHGAHGELLKTILAEQKATRRDFGGIREDIRSLRASDLDLSRRVTKLEGRK